jgi:hypothetical protein
VASNSTTHDIPKIIASNSTTQDINEIIASNSTSDAISQIKNNKTSIDINKIKNAADLSNRAKVSCYFWVDWSYYDINKLTKLSSDYQYGEAEWNFCKFASNATPNKFDVTETFAYLRDESTQFVLPMTDDDLTINTITKDKNGANVTITQDSDIDCPSDASVKTSFTAILVCDKNITG